MKANRIIALITALILVLIVASGCNQQPKNPQPTMAPSDIPAEYLSGMLLYGVSPSPYSVGEIAFESPNEATFMYKAYGANAVIPDITEGYDATDWTQIKSGETIKGTDCRNIAVATVDKNRKVLRCAKFYYVPGITYANPNPDQYDDADFFEPQSMTNEDPRAVALASALLQSPQTSFYGKTGGIVQGFLTTYSQSAYPANFQLRFHTGTDFYIANNQPFYSPLDGKILYAGNDDYKMIIIYNQSYEITTLLLHAQDNTPAKKLLEAGGTVQKGQLLGYGGSSGSPTGTSALHIEVRLGMVARYQSFSTYPEYARKTNYDPMILSDLFPVKDKIERAEYIGMGNTMQNLENNGIAAVQANWIFFRNTADGGKLYKSRPNDSSLKKMTEEAVQGINIWGDWIYYINQSESNYIYKMKTDGSERTLVLNNSASKLIFNNNTLYFINASDKGYIYSVDTNGQNLRRLNGKQTFLIFYYNNTLYYTVGSANKLERIYALAPDGSAEQLLFNTRTDGVMIYRDTLYYRDFTQALQYVSMPLAAPKEQAAQEKKILLDHVPTTANVSGNFLIYTNNNDGDSIYRKNLMTDDASLKLTDQVMCRNINILNNWIYYEVDGSPVKLYRMRIDGTERQVMSPGNIWGTITSDGTIVFPTPPPTATPGPTAKPEPTVTASVKPSTAPPTSTSTAVPTTETPPPPTATPEPTTEPTAAP